MTGPTYIMVPPGMKVEHLVGEQLTVTVTWDGGLWTAERIEREREGE